MSNRSGYQMGTGRTNQYTEKMLVDDEDLLDDDFAERSDEDGSDNSFASDDSDFRKKKKRKKNKKNKRKGAKDSDESLMVELKP